MKTSNNPYFIYQGSHLVIPYKCIDTGFHIWPFYNRETDLANFFNKITPGSFFKAGCDIFQVGHINIDREAIPSYPNDFYKTTFIFECLRVSDKMKFTFMTNSEGTVFGYSEGMVDLVMKVEHDVEPNEETTQQQQ